MNQDIVEIVMFCVVVIGATWKLSASLTGIQSQISNLAEQIKRGEDRHDATDTRFEEVETRLEAVEHRRPRRTEHGR